MIDCLLENRIVLLQSSWSLQKVRFFVVNACYLQTRECRIQTKECFYTKEVLFRSSQYQEKLTKILQKCILL